MDMMSLTIPQNKKLLKYNFERYFYKISNLRVFCVNYKTSKELLDKLIETTLNNLYITGQMNMNDTTNLLNNILKYDIYICINTKNHFLNMKYFISEDSIDVIISYLKCSKSFCNNLGVIEYDYESKNIENHYYCIECYNSFRKFIYKIFI